MYGEENKLVIYVKKCGVLIKKDFPLLVKENDHLTPTNKKDMRNP